MKNIKKKYSIKDSEIEVTIQLGFDRNMILDHEMCDDNIHILYMFITTEELESNSKWIWSNKETNPFIIIMLTDHNNLDDLVLSVDNIYEKVNKKLESIDKDEDEPIDKDEDEPIDKK